MLTTGRDVIVSLRQHAAELNWATRRLISQLGCGPKLGQYRGCRAGRHVKQRLMASRQVYMYSHTSQATIPVITSRCRQFCDQSYSRPNSVLYHGKREKRTSVLQQVNCRPPLLETHTRSISTAVSQFGNSIQLGAIPVIVGNRPATGVPSILSRDDCVSALNLAHRHCAQHHTSANRDRRDRQLTTSVKRNLIRITPSPTRQTSDVTRRPAP